MNKFQLRPIPCDRHKSAEITYDGNVYKECPLCSAESSENIEDLKATIAELREDNEEQQDDIWRLRQKIEKLLYGEPESSSDE